MSFDVSLKCQSIREYFDNFQDEHTNTAFYEKETLSVECVFPMQSCPYIVSYDIINTEENPEIVSTHMT